jgi:hypothetical protein
MKIELTKAVVEKALLVIRDRETFPPTLACWKPLSFSTCPLMTPNTSSWHASSVSHFSPMSEE